MTGPAPVGEPHPVSAVDAEAVGAANRRIAGHGTSERQWQEWSGWADGRVLDLAGLLAGSDRLVVVAPHPDDETLAAGGLMHDAVRAGRQVLVVAVTPGDASHPGSRRWPRELLTVQRQRERADALACLGLDAGVVFEAGIGDGTVSEHRDELAAAIAERLTERDLVVVPWRHDGHPDHEASSEAGLAAAEQRGVRAVQAPIWGWHWASPAGGQLPPVPLLYRLSEPAWQAKQAAVASFTSQLQGDPSTGAEPILPDWALRRWLRRTEVFFGD